MKVRVIKTRGHEHVAAFSEPKAGLTAYVAVHSTALGPSLGGVRMRPYPDEGQALGDALRLSRAMTYKAAMADLPLGGGKSVIVGDPARDKSPALWEAFGRCVESLGGRYIAAEDMGTRPEDMDAIARATAHVLGTSSGRGGTGNPAPYTARGVVQGIHAALKWRYGHRNFPQCRIAIQGLGAVGMELAAHLFELGAHLVVSDIRKERVEEAKLRFGAQGVRPDEIHKVACDVFAPCALGGILNGRTVGELRCAVVAGAANNQLASPEAGKSLARRGILYVPDYVLNAGGLIAAAAPLVGLDPSGRDAKISEIALRVLRVFCRAEAEGTRPEVAADRQAEDALRVLPTNEGRPTAGQKAPGRNSSPYFRVSPKELSDRIKARFSPGSRIGAKTAFGGGMGAEGENG